MRTVILASILIPCVALAQSFNIDLDIQGGSPEIGFGVPSDAFGAAANQPGRWNRYSVTGRVPIALRDLSGNLTNVTFRASGGTGSGGGWNNSLNTGDFALLYNDAAILFHGSITWEFSGLAVGWYSVFSYAVSPVPSQTEPIPTEVLVDGSISANPQAVMGPMPGNAHIYLVTHSIHEVFVNDRVLSITITGLHPQRLSKVNGFQISAVPEPFSMYSLVLGLVVFGRRMVRRQR